MGGHFLFLQTEKVKIYNSKWLQFSWVLILNNGRSTFQLVPPPLLAQHLLHHPDQHHNDPYRCYFDSDHQVNGPVKPVGQAAIKFMYTDWMDPKSTNSNMVRMLNPPTMILTSLTKVALDRMVGDYAFTCPVVNFAHYYARTSPPNEYDGPIPSF